MSGLTKDDVMGMALEAGLVSGRGVIQITKFAALVAAAEREACALTVEQAGIEGYGTLFIAAAIRARGSVNE